jgi:hypothetical protein
LEGALANPPRLPRFLGKGMDNRGRDTLSNVM